MIEKFEEIVDGFVNNKVGLTASFIPAELIKALQKDLSEIHFNGLMNNAGVGNIASKMYAPEIRKDKIYWLDNKTKNLNQQEFLDIVAQFVSYLNRTCYTGINDYEFHYAVYEPGSFYKKHKDQFRNDTGRKFSFITYLNDNWTDGDGGQLLIYNEGTLVSVLPEAGTSVFFKSDESEHEVALAHRLRMSVTGWLKRV